MVQHDAGSSVQSFIDDTYPRNDTLFYKVMAIDNTGLPSLCSDIVSKPPSFASDEVWSGTINLSGSITVPAGKSLTLRPGTSLRFNNSSSLNVYGTLNINGTAASNVVVDFVAPIGSPFNCIWANAGSTVNIKHAEVKNAAVGVWSSDAVVHIDSSNFHDMYMSAYLYNTITSSNGCSIKNTYIRNMASCGL